MQTEKKILIYGASGPVSYELCKCLESKGVNFKAACHCDSKHQENKDKIKGTKKNEICEIDWCKPNTIKECLKDVDKVFLKTPIGKTVDAVRCFCDCIKDSKDKIQTLVFFSVLGAEEKKYEMASEFGEAEKMLKNLNLPNLVIIRPTFLFSNFFIDCKNIKEKNRLCRPLGENCVNIVSDHDIAECICQCLLGGPAQGSNTLVLGNKECLTMNDVCKYLTNILGKKVEYCDCGLEEFEKYLSGTGLSREGIQSYLGMMKFARDGGFNRKFDDLSKIIGKEPKTFQEMLQKDVECFK